MKYSHKCCDLHSCIRYPDKNTITTLRRLHICHHLPLFSSPPLPTSLLVIAYEYHWDKSLKLFAWLLQFSNQKFSGSDTLDRVTRCPSKGNTSSILSSCPLSSRCSLKNQVPSGCLSIYKQSLSEQLFSQSQCFPNKC